MDARPVSAVCLLVLTILATGLAMYLVLQFSPGADFQKGLKSKVRSTPVLLRFDDFFILYDP